MNVVTISNPTRFTCEVVESREALARHQQSWDDLAANIAEPNVFYESWMLLPALAAFADKAHLRFLLVLGESPENSDQEPILCGLFPFECVPLRKPFPIQVFRFWRHPYCFLGSPLIRKGYVQDCLNVVFGWLQKNPLDVGLVQFNDIVGEGAFARQLESWLTEQRLANFVQSQAERALMACESNADAYLQAALSKPFRKKMNRYRRRLSELGTFETVDWSPTDDVDRWIQQYLDLEEQGWKGRERSAIALHPVDREWFRDVLATGLRNQRVQMPTFVLNDAAIAMQVNLFAEPGSFAFKTSYDENYAQYSPGTLLEVENIRQLHDMSQIEWMDSCADPNHPTMNRVYGQRRTLRTVLVSLGGLGGECILRLWPLLRGVRRWIRQEATSLTPK